jgi:hypothetical protein
MVAVTARGAGGEEVGFGTFDTAQAFVSERMILKTIVLDGTLPITTTGCVAWRDSAGSWRSISGGGDDDCDEVPTATDCDDRNPHVFSNVDDDLDGFFTCSGTIDCDDSSKEVHPGAAEDCGGRDQNCDGKCDPDGDEDG